MYKIYEINPNNLTENEIKNLYSINVALENKYNFLHRLNNVDDYKNLFLSSFTNIDTQLLLIEKDSKACGILTLIKTFDWNGNEQHKLTISLCDIVTDETLVSFIGEVIKNKLDKYNELSVVTYNNELQQTIEKHTYKVALRGNYYTLNKSDIDISSLSKYIAEQEIKNSDLSIRFTDIISENLIEEYCNLFMETMEDMTDVKEDGYVQYVITPEKQRQINESNKKRNLSHFCYMIFNSNNELVAKSNVSVNNNDSRFPYQFMIGVKRPYRGRNLGKWLYASMYKKLFETVNFEKALVCHHPDNIPAINVSKWIGYKFNYLETTYNLYRH
ncbi:GNAT family N-acetyltransferase [Clostridium tunisiense]|uniref:GNAT family N-acetyltransferase n=1 Tax=Clostridium tunisiense TaxID=219748 RepID=UPI0002EE9614|nr:GNAT family N-acetyltransferase [Clostridium tunisiense]